MPNEITPTQLLEEINSAVDALQDAEEAAVAAVAGLATAVKTTGDQTVAGTKTFSSSPVVPNATQNGQAVNLGQLNSVAGGGAIYAESINDVDLSEVTDGKIIVTNDPVPGTVNAVLAEVENSLSSSSTKVPTSYAVSQALGNAGGSVYAETISDVDVADVADGTVVVTEEPVTGNSHAVLCEVEQTVSGAANKVPSSAAVAGIARNPGEILYSLLPLNDAGLHLLDGSVLSGNGTYADFVGYVADIIENQPNISNVDKVGNLVDVDNVLSGFTTSSYAKLPLAFSPGSSPWEMVFKITTSGDVTTTQVFLAADIYGIDPINCLISSGHFMLEVSYNSTEQGPAATGTYNVQQNTTYYLRIKFTGSQYTLEYSLDGTNFATDITISSSTAVFGGRQLVLGLNFDNHTPPTASLPFLGSIDLYTSYININGSRWWSGTHKAGFMDEAEWQAIVSKYKACGCFVYDEVANTLRLPKVTGFVEGTVDPTAIGQLVEAGLPNINGTFRGVYDSGNIEGAFSGEFADSAEAYYWAGMVQQYKKAIFSFDASRSSTIYGNSTTVQPQAIKGFVYMVVANRTKTQVVADIDQITADLQLKADVDLGNVTSVGQERMAHAVSCSNKSVSITVPSSNGKVTAPADGWMFFAALCVGPGVCTIGLANNGSVNYESTYLPSGVSTNLYVSIYIGKGSQVNVYYSSNEGTISNKVLTFRYAQGSAS